MRQGQQNRRGRGRNNNQNNNQQRKGQNPLTRSFESNGPDVKLRGTPAHIAEKYMSLARDAQSSGDPVLAENYLQHAEHYNRIIQAYREQQISQGGVDPGYNGGGFAHQNRGEGYGSDADAEEGFDGPAETPAPARQFASDQPRIPEPGERRFEDRPPRQNEQRFQHQGRDRDRGYQGDRNGFRDRHDRGDRPERQFDRPDRPERGERFDRQDRPERSENRIDRDRQDRPERFDRQPPPQAAEARNGEPRPEVGIPQRRRERPAGDRLPEAAHEQPEFLRRPVRRPRRDDQDEAVSAPAPAAIAASEDSE